MCFKCFLSTFPIFICNKESKIKPKSRNRKKTAANQNKKADPSFVLNKNKENEFKSKCWKPIRNCAYR